MISWCKDKCRVSYIEFCEQFWLQEATICDFAPLSFIMCQLNNSFNLKLANFR